MRAVLYNRILIFLGFLGIFVAGELSLAKLMNVVLPCGASSSCETVTNDPSSMLFGVIPIAYIGFGCYLLLTALALLRTRPNFQKYLPSILVGYGITAVGTVISIGLQLYSILVITALCKWCLTSAVTMTISVIVYALYYQEVSDLDSETLATVRARAADKDWIYSIAVGLIGVLALAGEGYSLRYADHSKGRIVVVPKNYPLIPANPNVYGDPNSPVKVIEFADLNCPACQKWSPMLKEYVRQHTGIAVFYRHCPLPTHKTSAVAAAIDEYAAEKGKFWDYTMAVMGTKKEIDDPNELFLIAGQQGLDVDDLRRRLANEKDPIYDRLNADQNAAAVVGVAQTPTFIVEIPNTPPKAFSGGGLLDAFGQKPYTDYIKTKSS